jgi:TRAP-type mannitol/chloroaromatic compound transport system permease small subunit
MIVIVAVMMVVVVVSGHASSISESAPDVPSWQPSGLHMGPPSGCLMLALADRIDCLSRAVGRAAAWLCLAVALLQFALVVARYVFSLGSVWLTEAVIYGHAALIMLAAAWTLQAGSHVRVDVFFEHAGPRARALIDLVGAILLLMPFMLVLLWLSWPYAARSWAILERSREASGLPLVFVLKTLIPLFAVLMALQGVSQAIRAADALSGRR